MAADECRIIPTSLIDDPSIVLRPVIKNSIEYLERRDSMARFGLTNSILVYPSRRDPSRYELIDGLWRLTVAREIPIDSLPCIIKFGISDEDALALQIQGNAIRAETTPAEFSRQMRRILNARPGMTNAELARIVGKHPTWVKDRLNLLRMSRDIQLMVDRGEIPTMSAYMLAKIPARWRHDYLDQARSMPTKKFCALAAGIIKQFTECIQKGKMDERYLPAFTPQAHLRSLKDIRSELDNPQEGATLIVAEGCKTLLDAWNLCLRWALHLDKRSIEEQKSNAELKARSRFHQEDQEALHEVDDTDDA